MSSFEYLQPKQGQNADNEHGEVVADPHGIRAARKARGWSERDLARRAGVHYQRVQSLERLTAKGEIPFSKALGPIKEVLSQPEGAEPRFIGSKSVPRVEMGDVLPVYDPRPNPTGGQELPDMPMNTIKRPGNLQNISDAYGVQLRETTMAPMYRPGDVLVMNPHQAPRIEAGVILMSEDHHDIVIGEFVSETVDEWVIKKYGKEPTVLTLSRHDYPVCHCVAVVFPAR